MHFNVTNVGERAGGEVATGHRYLVDAENVVAKIDGTDVVFKRLHAELVTDRF